MTETATASALAYYARHGAALFPIPYGSKAPTGIVASFAHDYSADPAQWEKWHAEHNCNFGLISGPSRIIIADVDVSEIGRDRAWQIWAEWWTSRGLTVPPPHVQSARGGWHTLLAVPADVDISTLRQVALIGPPEGCKKAVVDLRVGNGFVVAAGSYYDGTARNEASGHYLLMTDAAPYPAPAELLEHCKRVTNRPASTGAVGSYDLTDLAGLVSWLAERGSFSDYEAWLSIGMALRIEAGDAGLAIWELSFDGSVTADVAESKWNSFAAEPQPGCVTVSTWMQRAHKLGWKGTLRKSTSSMFDGVAAIAAAAGATLSSAPSALIGQTWPIIGRLGQPILDTFLEATEDLPTSPERPVKYPTLPEQTMGMHPLFELLNHAINRIVIMAETPKTFRQQRIWNVLKVLRWTHQPTYDALIDFINVRGCTLSPGELEKHNKNFEVAVVNEQRESSGPRGFVLGPKGLPDPQVSDNVGIFLGMADVRLQYDEFTKRPEIAESESSPFVRTEQYHLDKYWYLAKSANYGFHPSKDLFRTGFALEARATKTYDSLRDRVDALAIKWDGVARLETWLTRSCGVADDLYHRAVGRNLIGGMVCRARYDGCVQDETVIFISPQQGTGKSTLCKILSLEDDWYLGKFKLGGSDQNSLPLLAGKWIVEMSELAGLNKADFEDVKSFLTSKSDEYVAKYEAIPTVHKRRCCFIGTSNQRQPLADPSGNRRFLPVHVKGKIDLVWLRENVEQLIGEAAARDTLGETFSIPEEVWDITTAQQEAARNISPVEEAIHDWFDRPEEALYVLAADIRRALDMAGLHATARYSVFMENLGWRYTQAPTRGRDRIWMKGNNFANCHSLEPAQRQVNGRVEMIIRAQNLVAPVQHPAPMPARIPSCPIPAPFTR